ncbi:allophanate hydrolase [Phenylobacterium sp.]|jgi:allophanate hydrolase|uniref:allophanate hydrolase n=1 Tax=Phenylobacterium sp. TaxID=1871053 RepID=UPI002E37FF07|nr:allophanate hydrolase [Phenylobacterium sp.]HEX4710807.1 allophanate hydrolase [Phenylobacterium sp.]
MSSFDRLFTLDIAADVAAGVRSAAEIAREALTRVAAYEAVQPQVWISRFSPDQVMAQAEAVDRRIAAGERLPLAGAPFAVKDNLDVAGLPTTAGCPAFAYRPEVTSPVVQRLLDAGAVLVGKTNLDQFATGLVGARSPYGACGCVYDREFISGGSSSGSAVAVAAGLVAFALGTDTAGSGRVPAAFNHLVGLKPTKGRWSTRGLVPACRTLDCVTVFTSTAREAAAIDEVVAGFDVADTYSRRPPSDDGAPIPDRFRFAVPRREQLEWFSDPQSARLFEGAVARLQAMGGSAVEIDISTLRAAADLLYQGPWVAERTAAVHDLLRERPSVIHPVVRQILEGGLRATAVEAFQAEYQLRNHQRAAEQLWQTADVLLLPTAATTYRIREVLAEPMALNANLGRYTNFVNLLDMSAVAVPAGFRDNGTGFGVTLIGPAWADRRLLALARRYEEIAPMPESPPLDLSGAPQSVKLAVVGAHLAAMPLHWQLTSRDARLVRRCTTAPVYKLYAMANTTPPKPALVHAGGQGAAIEVEVYELATEAFGSFVAEVPPPLAIGTVTLEDGTEVKGFVAEPRALDGAEDITALGGWRAYIAREQARA